MDNSWVRWFTRKVMAEVEIAATAAPDAGGAACPTTASTGKAAAPAAVAADCRKSRRLTEPGKDEVTKLDTASCHRPPRHHRRARKHA